MAIVGSIPEGIHTDLPFSTYRRAEGVSQSMLAKLTLQTPAHLNAETLEEEEGEEDPVLRLGTLTHESLTDEHGFKRTFNERFAIKPKGMKFSTTEGMAWKAEALAQRRLILTENDRDLLFNAVLNIRAHPFARRLFELGTGEISLFQKDTVNGIMRKARIDYDPLGDVIVDFKTARDASRRGFYRAVRENLYHLQAAWYLILANLLGMEKKHFVFIVIEKTPPLFPVACYALGAKFLRAGHTLATEAYGRYIECTKLGVWPGYSDEVEILELD